MIKRKFLLKALKKTGFLPPSPFGGVQESWVRNLPVLEDRK